MLDTTERLAIEDRLEVAKKDWAHPTVQAVLLDAWKLLSEVERLRHEVAKVPQDIGRRVDRHANTWSGRSDHYWFYRLSQEVGELGSSLALDHKHSPEHEIAQIASICINWLARKEREAEAEVRRDDRIMESPESEPLPEPQEEEVHY